MSANKGISRVAGFLSKLRGDVGGNALAMMAAAMIPLAGMIGGGLDMSRAYMARAKLQNACDAAALAARQGMDGTNFTSADTATANKYFNFNFPSGTMNANSVTFSVAKDPNDQAALIGSATAKIPTSLMKIFSYDEIDINVSCNVKRDLGNNDIMIVLDVTGSMNCDPGGADCDGDSDSKIARLRTGTLGLYRALQGDGTDRSRFGLMPYSGTVNVGRRLRTRDILRTTDYSECNNGYYYSWYWSGYPNGETGCSSVNADLTGIHINQTEWFDVDSGVGQAIRAWRLSGEACIEERPTIGNAASPIRISSAVSQADIDDIASSGSDEARQWGRYETPPTDRDGNFLFMPAYTQVACPSEAQKLRTYGTEAAFQTAVNNATANVTGGTYHDVGLIWGARWLSPTGMFAATNPSEFNGFPVNKHIVFMTDGILDTGGTFYSAFGVGSFDNRRTGTADADAWHVEHFHSACARAKAMSMTIWVIALDVADTSNIQPCATSIDHFYTSDGTDLEEVFTKIGQGIGDLRLTS